MCLQLENIFQKTSSDSKILDYIMSSVSSFLCGFFERTMYVFEACKREKVPITFFFTRYNYKTVIEINRSSSGAVQTD